MLICMASALASRNRVQQLTTFRGLSGVLGANRGNGMEKRYAASPLSFATWQERRMRELVGSLHNYNTRGSPDDDPRCTIWEWTTTQHCPGLRGGLARPGSGKPGRHLAEGWR